MFRSEYADVFLAAVPRATSGKILRRELRAAHKEPS
ncbi:acyl-coenzyme A synthetase/AMP-(fatty) acid ligase [Streptomyces sp. TE5632]